MDKHLNYLKELDIFFSKKKLEISKEKFDNSRKLYNFFNGIIRVFFLLNRIEALIIFIKSNLDEISNQNKNKEFYKEQSSNNFKVFNQIKNERNEISNILLSLYKVKILDFSKLIVIDNLENSSIRELFEFDDVNIYRKRCQLCLHDINVDGNTKLFSGDYHILCINYWINAIDNNSPFSI